VLERSSALAWKFQRVLTVRSTQVKVGFAPGVLGRARSRSCRIAWSRSVSQIPREIHFASLAEDGSRWSRASHDFLSASI
jgi:hypothetical protein